MADLINPIEVTPVFVETRLAKLTINNHLDAVGELGTPGKYEVIIETVGEQQDINNNIIFLDGIPVRNPKQKISFDPAYYAAIVITRDDNTQFYLGNLFADIVTAVDAVKGGLPPIP
jgi:hypothetical protein